MYCQSEEKQADCLSKNASTLFLPLAFLRVSALPELNYTALANGASVYGIAQYHLIIRQRSQDNRDAVQCNKHQRNEVLFTELHSIMQQQGSPTRRTMRLCNAVNISAMKPRDV